MAKPVEGAVSIEELKLKENPTNADLELIAEHTQQESIKEIERENETDEQRTARETQEKTDADAEIREGLDTRAKEAGLKEGATEEEIAAKEKEAGTYQESEEEKTAREEQETKDKEELEADVKSYAEENKVSEEDARKELEHVSKVSEKYEGNPRKLAKALLSQQREGLKLNEQIKEASKPKPIRGEDITVEAMTDLINKGQITMGGKVMTPESIIQQYRDKYPKISEELSDEKVTALAAEKMRERFIAMDSQTQGEIKDAASKRRQELLDKLPESDKKYIPDIKPFLDNAPDAEVIDEGYDLEDFILHAKGKILEKEKKEEYDRGYKKGLEDKKIIGIKKEVPKGKAPVKTDTNASKIAAMTEDDKQRALDMYDNPAFTTEKKYLAYLEYKEFEAKK